MSYLCFLHHAQLRQHRHGLQVHAHGPQHLHMMYAVPVHSLYIACTDDARYAEAIGAMAATWEGAQSACPTVCGSLTSSHLLLPLVKAVHMHLQSPV